MRNVPQEKYTRDYFVHNCEGYTPTGEPGRRLLTLLGHMEQDPGQRVLDLGCGRGEVAKHLTGRGHSVLSVDYSIAAAELFFENNGAAVPFVRHDLSLGMPWLASGGFDCVVLADVVEHLYDEQLRVVGAEVVRLAHYGALILIDTPIMQGGESELHVDIKDSWEAVHEYFPGTALEGTHWHKKPEHCNLIFRKVVV